MQNNIIVLDNTFGLKAWCMIWCFIIYHEWENVNKSVRAYIYYDRFGKFIAKIPNLFDKN